MISNLFVTLYQVLAAILSIPFRLMNELIAAIDNVWQNFTGFYVQAEEETEEEPDEPQQPTKPEHNGIGFKHI